MNHLPLQFPAKTGEFAPLPNQITLALDPVEAVPVEKGTDGGEA